MLSTRETSQSYLEQDTPYARRRIRVLLVDDQRAIRRGLAGLLQSQSDLEVVGEAGDGATAIALCRELLPDVILMDVTMPGMNGIEATRHIAANFPEVRVIGLSMHDAQGMAALMRESGAADYLSKSSPPNRLIAAIRGV